ncbi:peptidoglycan-binding protein [Streptomyces sp. SM13]|uniref:peptidoglycan-binding protein n=1 Tax=Streptomyces sp. SM13 TaxID=1983803 RepID=UPI002156601C|nr:peptidoglycan-binding protein [Streptomyces sp. SM13]
MSKDDSDVSSNLSVRRRWAGGVVVGAVVLSTLSVGIGQQIKSPAQAIADSSPPAPSVLTSPVEYRVLETSVMLRGTVTAAQSVDVTPTGGAPGAASAVVTKQPVSVGQDVRAGQLLLEVSGRPVVALKGSLPVYRDLKPGADGDDVAQLQSALQALGHHISGDRRGHFGAGTKSALTDFYKKLGYEPRPAAPEGETGVSEAEDVVVDAQRAVEDARDALEDSRGTATNVEAPRTGVAPAGPSASPPDSAPAPGALDRTGGVDTPSDLRKQLERAKDDLREAREKLSQAEMIAGPMLPASEVVFLSEFPARVDGIDTKVGSTVTGRALKLSAGALTVQGYLQPHEKGLVRPRQHVEVFSELTGRSAAATVSSVSEAAASEQSTVPSESNERAATGAKGYLMVVKPTERLPRDMAGQDVRLTVRAASTKGKALVVPVSAIAAGADGRTAVTVRKPDGSQRRIAVTVGASGDGYVEVRAEGKEELHQGDHVLTGVRDTHVTGKASQ